MPVRSMPAASPVATAAATTTRSGFNLSAKPRMTMTTPMRVNKSDTPRHRTGSWHEYRAEIEPIALLHGDLHAGGTHQEGPIRRDIQRVQAVLAADIVCDEGRAVRAGGHAPGDEVGKRHRAIMDGLLEQRIVICAPEHTEHQLFVEYAPLRLLDGAGQSLVLPQPRLDGGTLVERRGVGIHRSGVLLEVGNVELLVRQRRELPHDLGGLLRQVQQFRLVDAGADRDRLL